MTLCSRSHGVSNGCQEYYRHSTRLVLQCLEVDIMRTVELIRAVSGDDEHQLEVGLRARRSREGSVVAWVAEIPPERPMKATAVKATAPDARPTPSTCLRERRPHGVRSLDPLW